MKKEIYKDETFELATTELLNRSKQKFQLLVDEYMKLKGNVNSSLAMYALAWKTDIMQYEVIEAKKHEADSLPEPEKQEFLDRIEKPNFNQLDRMASDIRQDANGAESLMLFTMNGKKVVTTRKAKEMIKSHSVYATNPEQEKFSEDISKVAELLNSLNDRAGNKLLGNFNETAQQYGNIFDSGGRGTGRVNVSPEKLRELLNYIY